LQSLADAQGRTLAGLVEAWAVERAQAPIAPAEQRYETFEEFFTNLGMSQEEIRQAQELAETEDADV
jgi:hypothetical protein